jgi:hypothetical protein
MEKFLCGQPQYLAQYLADKEKEYSSTKTYAPLKYGEGLCTKNLLEQWGFSNQYLAEKYPAVDQEKV